MIPRRCAATDTTATSSFMSRHTAFSRRSGRARTSRQADLFRRRLYHAMGRLHGLSASRKAPRFRFLVDCARHDRMHMRNYTARTTQTCQQESLRSLHFDLLRFISYFDGRAAAALALADSCTPPPSIRELLFAFGRRTRCRRFHFAAGKELVDGMMMRDILTTAPIFIRLG